MGCGINETNRKWPNGIIPFVIDDSYLFKPDGTPDVPRQAILDAINEINRSTNIQLVVRTDQKHFIHFRPSDEFNSSDVGCQKEGRQYVNIHADINAKHSIIHETCHAIGLYHEHSRYDRDSYITVYRENSILDNRRWKRNFNKKSELESIFGYNLDSIMHYKEYAFSLNGKKTITVNNGNTVPNLESLSSGDVAVINYLYPDNVFGDLMDDYHFFWKGNFLGKKAENILFYHIHTKKWWLAHYNFSAGTPIVDNVQANMQKGNLLKWIELRSDDIFEDFFHPLIRHKWLSFLGNFSGRTDFRTELLLYRSDTKEFLLGSYGDLSLSWQAVGDTNTGSVNKFGDLTDNKHSVWVGDFNHDGRTEILFYFEEDGNWWLGSYEAANGVGKLKWTLVDNTRGVSIQQNLTNDFGPLLSETHTFFIGDFTTGHGKDTILMYNRTDGNWWNGVLNGNQIVWKMCGNTSSFGDLMDDNHLFFQGRFTLYKNFENILFYYKNDGNWWLAHYDNGLLNWRLASNTNNAFVPGQFATKQDFGNLLDGQHIPFYALSNDHGHDAILYYYEVDGFWWKADFQISNWSLVSVTPEFGRLNTKNYLFFSGNFDESGYNVVFYNRLDGCWWIGYETENKKLEWIFADRTDWIEKRHVLF